MANLQEVFYECEDCRSLACKPVYSTFRSNLVPPYSGNRLLLSFLRFYPEHRDSRFSRNVDKDLPDYKLSYYQKSELTVTTMREPRISYTVHYSSCV
jgi:hypothetical protein